MSKALCDTFMHYRAFVNYYFHVTCQELRPRRVISTQTGIKQSTKQQTVLSSLDSSTPLSVEADLGVIRCQGFTSSSVTKL